MWVIVCGSRGAHIELDYFSDILAECGRDYNFEVSHILHGGCPNSPDTLARDWYKRLILSGNSDEVGYTKLPARWSDHKRSSGKNPAGVIRNDQLVRVTKAGCRRGGFLLAFWDGVSHGTRTTIEFAQKAKMQGRVYQLDDEGWYYDNLWEVKCRR